ncbi:MAG TPA: tetratricopeptide repeat protein [Haliangiales bacterium]|nr:tetratricopeptide repeat protein [Haliangiales bacterium]
MLRLHVPMALVLALAAGAARAASFEEGLALKKQEKLAEAEAVFAEIVREQPTDAAALAQWATLLGWLGRFDDSIAAWGRALAEKPDEPDYVMGIARAQYWKGDLAPARARLEGLLAAAPQHADALALLGDVCLAAHDYACAHDRYQGAAALAPSAELEKKLARSAGPPVGRFDAGGQIDSYDTARNIEGSFFAQGSWQALDALVLSGGYEQLRQFGVTDHRFNIGGYLHPMDGVLLNAKVSVSPTADTVAPWEALGGAEVEVYGQVTALANVRHMHFSSEGVTIIGAGARLDLGRFSLTGQGGVVVSSVNALQGFGSGKIEWSASDDWRLYAGFARGAQTVRDPALTQVLEEVATDVVAGVTWQIDRAWGVRLDYTHETFGTAFVRNSVGSAVTFKF